MNIVSNSIASVINTGITTKAVNQNPPYAFLWDMTSEIANYGTTSPVSQPNVQYFGESVISGNPYDSNNPWLHIASGNFPAAYWYNNTNANVWGGPRDRNEIELDWMYSTAYRASALILQLNGKSQNGSLDANDGLAIRTTVVGGASAPAITIDCTANWYLPAANTPYKIIARWDNSQSNPNGDRLHVLYLLQDSGAIRISACNTNVGIAPKADVWHHFLPGNDTTNAMENWLNNIYIRKNWTFDLPVNIWQDFEFDTLNLANIEASDHSPQDTWTLVGSTTGFSTDTGGQITSPSTINLWNDTGTRGLKNNLAFTEARSIGVNFPVTAAVKVWALAFKTANLASGTSARITFIGGASGVDNDVMLSMDQRNVSGVQKIQLVSPKNSTTASGDYTVNADTNYWGTMSYTRNGLGRMQVFEMTTGAALGAEITMSCPNNSVSRIAVGSFGAYTAQASGIYHYYDNFVVDNQGTPIYPLKPWV